MKKIVRIRSVHEKDFENVLYTNLCNELGISHEFSAPKILEQNEVIERKNTPPAYGESP